jgi:hypothetical protein
MNGLFLGLIFYRLSQINARQQGPWGPPRKYRPYTFSDILLILAAMAAMFFLMPAFGMLFYLLGIH